jgi:NADH dehydrogenase
MMRKEKTRIVILGAGFGGLYTYRSLYKNFKKNEIDVVLVNKTNYFLFTPLLHEVATGGLSEGAVVESVQHFLFKNKDTLHLGEVISVDTDNQIVHTNNEKISYDILVVALGASTQFFGTPGASENSFVLKDLSDAMSMRSKIIGMFEKASLIKDEQERKRSLSFVLVGGGPTGVELVAEISEFIHHTLLTYYKATISSSDVSITLINQGPELLAPFPQNLRLKALSILRNNNVKVMLETGVKEVSEDSVLLSNGDTIDSMCTIWTAGVKPNTEMFKDILPMNKGGRIIVDLNLQNKTFKNIFAVGDVAFLCENEESAPMPMTAQFAVRQGALVACNIKAFIKGKKMKPFVYRSQGELASVGRFNGVANINGITFSGPVAWFVWRTIYLFKFISPVKKIKVAFEWTINLFFSRDITKI